MSLNTLSNFKLSNNFDVLRKVFLATSHASNYYVFQNNTDYEQVVDLGKHVGFSLPASGLSLVQTEDVPEEPSQHGKNKRQPSSSTPIQTKKARLAPTEEPDISDVSLNAEIIQHPCIKCGKAFGSKYLKKKHESTCGTQVALEGKEQCEKCGEYFTVQGGWLVKVSLAISHKCPKSKFSFP